MAGSGDTYRRGPPASDRPRDGRAHALRAACKSILGAKPQLYARVHPGVRAYTAKDLATLKAPHRHRRLPGRNLTNYNGSALFRYRTLGGLNVLDSDGSLGLRTTTLSDCSRRAGNFSDRKLGLGRLEP